MPGNTPYPRPPAQAGRADAESAPLLAADEPAAFTVGHPEGSSPFFLTCDHAGKRLPRRLGKLGLPEAELERHIAWDIGAAGLSRLLADKLDAFLILQTYSRLVIDCNRAPGVPTSIVRLSEHTEIPGNRQLPPAGHLHPEFLHRPADLGQAMRVDLLTRFPGHEEMAAAVTVQSTE